MKLRKWTSFKNNVTDSTAMNADEAATVNAHANENPVTLTEVGPSNRRGTPASNDDRE